MASQRSLLELVNTDDPGWPVVVELIANATNHVEVLSVDRAHGERTLLALQVTTRSLLGAVAYECGGLMIDHGWIRVLGSGHPRLRRDLASWNFLDKSHRLSGTLLVADDALGGFFAINGGAFEGPTGNVFYLPPDTLQWEDLDRGYSDFLDFLFTGDLAKFYEGQRWKDWASDVEKIPGDRAYSIAPFLWAREGGTIDQRSRKDVPIEELWALQTDLATQLAGVPDGGKVKIVIKR